MKKNSTRVLAHKFAMLKKFFASDPRVLSEFLFGSPADRTATARSDIDRAVLFVRDVDFEAEPEF